MNDLLYYFHLILNVYIIFYTIGVLVKSLNDWQPLPCVTALSQHTVVSTHVDAFKSRRGHYRAP